MEGVLGMLIEETVRVRVEQVAGDGVKRDESRWMVVAIRTGGRRRQSLLVVTVGRLDGPEDVHAHGRRPCDDLGNGGPVGTTARRCTAMELIRASGAAAST